MPRGSPNGNPKYKYIVETDNVEKSLCEAATILNRLRYTTKFWEEHYGFPAKEAKKRWEAQADKWILEHTKLIEEKTEPEKINL